MPDILALGFNPRKEISKQIKSRSDARYNSLGFQPKERDKQTNKIA
jgi:hypothetical protein